MSASIQAAKKALRRAATARLKMVSPAEISSDSELYSLFASSRNSRPAPTAAAVTARVLASPWYKNAVNISIYLSTSHSEIQVCRRFIVSRANPFADRLHHPPRPLRRQYCSPQAPSTANPYLCRQIPLHSLLSPLGPDRDAHAAPPLSRPL